MRCRNPIALKTRSGMRHTYYCTNSSNKARRLPCKRYLQRIGWSFTYSTSILFFQEDNDSGHGTNSLGNPAREAKVAMDLDYVDKWSPESFDLDPIGNVSRILKQHSKRRKSKIEEKLKKFLLKRNGIKLYRRKSMRLLSHAPAGCSFPK